MNNDIQITISNEKLLDILMHSATRDDIAQLRTEIRGLRTEIHDDAAQFKAEIRDDMAQFKAEIRDDMAQFKAEIRDDMAQFKAEIRDDMAQFKAEVCNNIAELRGDMAKFKAETYNKFAIIDTQFIEVNNRLNQVELKIEKAKNQMLLLMGTFSIFFLGVLAKGFHWL